MAKLHASHQGRALPRVPGAAGGESEVITTIIEMATRRCRDHVLLMRAITNELAGASRPASPAAAHSDTLTALQNCMDTLEEELWYLQDIMGDACV